MEMPALVYPTMANLTEEILHNYKKHKSLSVSDMVHLLTQKPKEEDELLYKTAYDVATVNVGNNVNVRGIIEIGNNCMRDCDYCGIRRSHNIDRYTLTQKQILETARYAIDKLPGLLLQSGEINTDEYVDFVADTVRKIKKEALQHSPLKDQFRVILSIGELSPVQYHKLKQAGVNRYLLRIETSNPELYVKFHPDSNFKER